MSDQFAIIKAVNSTACIPHILLSIQSTNTTKNKLQVTSLNMHPSSNDQLPSYCYQMNSQSNQDPYTVSYDYDNQIYSNSMYQSQNFYAQGYVETPAMYPQQTQVHKVTDINYVYNPPTTIDTNFGQRQVYTQSGMSYPPEQSSGNSYNSYGTVVEQPYEEMYHNVARNEYCGVPPNYNISYQNAGYVNNVAHQMDEVTQYVCLWEVEIDGEKIVCGKTYTDRDDLVKHTSVHIADKGDFKCCWHRCGRTQPTFKARYKLVNHVRVHTGERPYLCEYPGCGKTFARTENLKIHLRIHTGEKPFDCPHCHKKFANSSDRKKHLHVHSGRSKVFPCPFETCEKRYTHPSSLRKHIKKHEMEHATSVLKRNHDIANASEIVNTSFESTPANIPRL